MKLSKFLQVRVNGIVQVVEYADKCSVWECSQFSQLFECGLGIETEDKTVIPRKLIFVNLPTKDFQQQYFRLTVICQHNMEDLI